MWEKKVYPLDKSKNKSKGARKQRHHAVSSNKLLVPDRCGASSLRTHWSRLDYGSSSWMLNQLMNEFDDGFDDYDDDYEVDGDHGDDMGSANYEVEENESDVLTGCIENEQDEAEMMGYLCVEFERNVGSDDENAWILIGV